MLRLFTTPCGRKQAPQALCNVVATRHSKRITPWLAGPAWSALLLVLLGSGCTTTMRPVPPPSGMSLLKVNMFKSDARESTNARANCYIVLEDEIAVSVCNINDTQRPDAISKPGFGARSPAWTIEVYPSGNRVMWKKAYPLQPGHQRIVVENDPVYCGNESRWGRWVGRTMGAGLAGLAVASTQTAQGRATGSNPRPPLTMEFDAEAGKSYVLECDQDQNPWAWIAPEDHK